MIHYILTPKQIFNDKYLKIELKSQDDLSTIKELVTNLECVKKVNITDNKITDLTVYPSKFHEIEEVEREVNIILDRHYN